MRFFRVDERRRLLTRTSRSLNVLKKSEKGLLTEISGPFLFGRNLPQRADALLTEKF
jgi:hypothetical protein